MTPDEMRAEAASLNTRADELEVQLTRGDLKSMTIDAIVQAKADGRLDNLLGITKETDRV